MNNINLNFDTLDLIEEDEAKKLISELEREGGGASITKYHPDPQGFLATTGIIAIITVTINSGMAIAALATFVYRVFRKGIVIDCSVKPPSIYKNPKLPLGSLLILDTDGRQELHEGISSEAIADIVKKIVGVEN